jgi:hypothetical protein
LRTWISTCSSEVCDSAAGVASTLLNVPPMIGCAEFDSDTPSPPTYEPLNARFRIVGAQRFLGLDQRLREVLGVGRADADVVAVLDEHLGQREGQAVDLVDVALL